MLPVLPLQTERDRAKGCVLSQLRNVRTCVRVRGGEIWGTCGKGPFPDAGGERIPAVPVGIFAPSLS